MPSTKTLRGAVLLVTDERSRAVCSLLLRHQGYRVYEASHSEDVLNLATRHDIGLVVADAMGEAREALKQALTLVPGISCMFVRLRHDLREVEPTFIRPGFAEPFAAASSRN